MNIAAHLKDKGAYAVVLLAFFTVFTLLGVSQAHAVDRPNLGAGPTSAAAAPITSISGLKGSALKSGATLPYCTSEDDTNCFWDAQKLGNGKGDSYVVMPGGVYYMPKTGTHYSTSAGAYPNNGSTLKYCKYEDSTNCVFDSATGRDFIDLKGKTFFLPKWGR